MNINILPVQVSDKEWISSTARAFWNSTKIVSRGKLYDSLDLPGFIAELDGEKAGLILYKINNQDCQIIEIASIMQGKGVGSKLVQKLIETAKESNCKRIFLTTTNDNSDALHFYQKRGFKVVAVHKDVIKEYRKIKPEIPQTGLNNIPIVDELELEMNL